MIKIQNIYYMLAYAFQVLNEDSYAKIGLEDFEHVEDLLAAILAKGIANQIKRGLGHEYVPQTDALCSPHGKINISASLKENNIQKKRLVCEFDEYSENSYINQILKSTSLLLIHSDEVSIEQKKALKKVMLYFSAVDTLNPSDIKWASIKYNRNNATYKMLINICYLVIESLLPTMQQGSKKLFQFKDDNLHRLFEKFVLEYYRKHYPSCKVSAAHINWNVDDGIVDLLPAMKSDITLESAGKTLIIDTKYYGHTMQTNSLYNSRTIHSANIYQIFSYVKNKDFNHTGNVSGMLLYAKTDEEITPDNCYLMDGNRISVKTLDLDKDFAGIRVQLDKIIEEWLR
jgi:5-methylcytosine-specific restriction enzyme subunit McrC